MQIRIKYIIKMVVLVATIFFIHKNLRAEDFYKNQNGIWIVRHNLTSKDKIDNLIYHLKILKPKNVYLQIRGRGYSYYQSKIEPLSPTVDNNFDPLNYFLNGTDSLDFKVHAWINTYLLWTSPKDPTNENHLYYQVPQWFEFTLKPPDKHKNIRNIYLTPHLPEVRQYIVDLVDEIITNYKVDGIHLDYIRYDNKYYGYHDSGIKEFRSVFTQSDNSKWKLINNKDWKEFKANKVDFLVEDLYHLKNTRNIDLILSAAVKPNPIKAFNDFGQNWIKWLEKDWLNHVVIMNYTTDNTIFAKNISLIKNKGGNLPVSIGIGLWNKNEKQIFQQIQVCKNMDFDNIVLFSYDTILEKYFK